MMFIQQFQYEFWVHKLLLRDHLVGTLFLMLNTISSTKFLKILLFL